MRLPVQSRFSHSATAGSATVGAMVCASVADVPTAPSDRPLPPFLRACRGLPGGPDDRVPVWFMRQAGRSLPEYRAIRGSGSILDAIHDPELSAAWVPPLDEGWRREVAAG